MVTRLRSKPGQESAIIKTQVLQKCLTTTIGLTDGYDMPDDEKKKALYSKVQELVLQFQESKGSIICRELLGLEQKHDQPIPSKRTKENYAERPCADFCATAAALFEKNYLQSKQ
ncbi:C-GCAxxG-C-C family protein [Selenomonas ruminantium]|nr:C-GCAxxG-C-C family protein [Selenomonas ruminantium]